MNNKEDPARAQIRYPFSCHDQKFIHYLVHTDIKKQRIKEREEGNYTIKYHFISRVQSDYKVSGKEKRSRKFHLAFET